VDNVEVVAEHDGAENLPEEAAGLALAELAVVLNVVVQVPRVRIL
jgi:hypothetical protein